MELEVLIENVLNALTAGITIGCIYGLMCIGLGLIFGIMKIVNFAQGELLMLGMFTSLYLVTGGGVLAFLGPYIGPFVGALLAAPVVFIAGALMHRFLISRVSGLRTAGSLDEGHFGQLIVTLGISLILQNGGLIVFGSTPEAVRTPLSAEAFLIDGFYGDATIFLNKAKLIAFFVAIVVAVALYLLLEYTRMGKALRAAADNPTAATYMGINVDNAYRIAFGLGSAITAVAGGLMATYISFGPFVGFDYVIIMYSGVVLGGMGSILGAFWGGLTVGFVQQFSALILPPQLQNAAIFVVFLLIVLLRPQGLFGRSAERA
ncbi:MAG: branched-chain amino acid ABC transporter permease [Acetobacteraceae bacterium]